MKLTMPAAEVGHREIRVDGLEVGRAMTVWDNRDTYRGAWQADLWERPVELLWPVPPDRQIKRLRLREVRAALRERLETSGPWRTEKEGER